MSDNYYKFFYFKDIEKLSIVMQAAKKNMTDLRYRILKYYIENPGISVYRICKDKSFLHTKYPTKSIYEVVKLLLKLNLIEKDLKQKEDYHCRLSTAGIFFLILNQDTHRLRLPITWNLLRELLDNYSDNVLFQFLIYPYIEYETLKNIADSDVFERLLIYLRDCCKTINLFARSINNTYNQKNGYLMDQLFIWENIPDEDHDVQSLRNFLKIRFRWNWINRAVIRRVENLIEISYLQHHAIIRTNPKQTKAELVVKGKSIYQFTTKNLTNTVAVYTDEFAIEGLKPFKKTVLETILLQFIIFQQTRILEFISSLFLIYGVKSPTTEILSKDRKFIHSVKKMKKHFDKVYGIYGQ
jgi:Fe2+ or Zn2+ uptake regulation protein